MSPGEQFDSIASAPEPIAGPWARYAARLTDLMLVASGLSLADTLFGLGLNRLPEIMQAILVGLVWLPVEAILLATAGTTPGKTLYGLRILSSNARRLRPKLALLRSLIVFLAGMGLCVWGVTIVALMLNFWSLSKRGTTPWDRAAGTVERLHPMGAPRLIVAVLVTCGLAYLISEGGLEGLRPPHVTSPGTRIARLAQPRQVPRRSGS